MDQDPDRRRDSTEIGAPFARMRVKLALVVLAIAVVVIAWRSLSG